MILYVDVPGIGGKHLSVWRDFPEGSAEVRDPGAGVVGRVVRAEFVGRGDSVVRLTLEVEDALLSDSIKRALKPSVF